MQALSFQRPGCLVILVFQGPAERLNAVKTLCDSVEAPDCVLLHEPAGNPAHGFNTGLKYCYEHCPGLQAVFFLNDTVRPYPFFTRQMAQAFTLTGTDVVYAGVNYQREDGLNSAPHCPFSHLFLKNIIPAGSFAVSFDALQKHRIFFDIRMGRAGEWHFLLRLVEKGFRFEALRESLAEIRESPETGNRLSPHEEAAIRSYIRSTRFSIDGHVMAEMAASVPGPTPRSCGIRNRGGEQGRWKWRVLKKIWSVLPLRLRALIKKGYMRFTVAVDAFWES